MLRLYQYLIFLLVWPASLILHVRALLGKEIKARINERFGISKRPKKNGYLVWCHAASIGEVLALLPLINKITETSPINILITTTTVSSAQVIENQFNKEIIHQFAPLDHITYVRRFLNHWRPNIALRIESELWPNTLKTTKEKNIPIVLLNGRLSEKSYYRWMKVPKTARKVMQYNDLVIAQSELDAHRFNKLGANVLKKTCNLKLAAQPLQASSDEIKRITLEAEGRPIWLAASTHDGEEELAVNTHISASKYIPDLLTVIAPRHVNRGHKIIRLALKRGLRPSLRSENGTLDQSKDIYVADTYGELGLFFSISPIVFLGKSITKEGGQNPLEPAHFGCAILFGPHMQNFTDIAQLMEENKMALKVNGADDLSTTVTRLLLSPNERNELAQNALNIGPMGATALNTAYASINELITNNQLGKKAVTNQ